ncbi:gliding motility-associated C-terminal domain-containing protein [Aquirufa sp.]|jgi:gliding motility-associated-like protein|uniref:T9SS type B sorting domain-containing protein n=1 Tax=Aquirufa sp. TaxID=2676249 RepID=UPI0037C0166D
MLRSLFISCFLLGVSYFTLGQNIIVRNNCITQCIDCSKRTPDMGTVFDLDVNMPTGTTYLWDFGEPGTPDNTSTSRTGSHLYCTPGEKTVTLKLSTSPTPIIKRIRVGELPFIYLGKDQNEESMTICNGQKVELKAFGKVGKPNFPVTVNWYPNGETTDNISLSKSGCYSVKVTEPTTGCTVEAKMQVKICGERDPDQNLIKNAKAMYMGVGAAIQFQGSVDNPVPIPGKTNVPNGVAKMEDPSMVNGLIFYTDGVKIFDKNNQPIVFSDPSKNLNADITNSQGVTIIPKTACKGCQSEYYVFTLGKNSAGENLVYYSIVDMKLNGGKGAISVINQLLNPIPVTSKLIALQGGQGYYWLVAQDAKTGDLLTYKVSELGISASTSSSGGKAFTKSSGVSGTTKSNIDWTKMAVTLPDVNMSSIDMYSLDPATGKSTFEYNIPLGKPLPQVYGVEFSQNNQVLYVSMQGDGSTVPSEIWQFDLSSKDPIKILASKSVLFSSMDKIGALQMDPVYNTVIFVSFEGSSSLAKISQTNGLNTDIDTLMRPKFVRNAVTFPAGVTTQLGLPPNLPVPNTPSGPPSISGPICEGTVFKFSIDQKLCDPLNNDKIVWNIYNTVLNPIPDKDGIMVPLDPGTTRIHTFTGNVLAYDFPTSGKYVITATISNSCIKDFLLDAQEFDIEVIKPTSIITEINKFFKCNPTSIPIALTSTPPSTNLAYLWSNGDKTPVANIRPPGGKVNLLLGDTKTKCSVRLNTQVNFLEVKNFIPSNTYSICMDNPKPFDLQLGGPTTNLKFEWTFGSGTSVISTQNKVRVTQAGKYVVKVTDIDNCSISHTVEVSDKCEPILLTPNVFTPNGDGKNDLFVPQPKSAKRARILGLQIFNRWGELLFTTKGPEFSWDGKVNGTRVPQQSYVWQLQYESLDYPERGVLTDRGGVLVVY